MIYPLKCIKHTMKKEDLRNFLDMASETWKEKDVKDEDVSKSNYLNMRAGDFVDSDGMHYHGAIVAFWSYNKKESDNFDNMIKTFGVSREGPKNITQKGYLNSKES